MRQDKHLLLDEISELVDKFDNFFVMRYEGLKPNQATEFRRVVAKKGGEVQMIRKRILVKALDKAGIGLDEVSLDGHIGVVFSTGDPVDMSKMLIQFGKENSDVIKIVGGRVDQHVYSEKHITILSELPSKPEMQAQLLAVLEAPLSQTLAVMEALLTSVPYCLENKSQQS